VKIAIATVAWWERGGTERVIMDHIQGLEQDGHQVMSFGATVDKKLFKQAENKISTYSLDLPVPFFRVAFNIGVDLMLSPLLAKRFKDYDLLLCHHLPGPWIGYYAKKHFGVPYICIVHHPPVYLYPELLYKGVPWASDKNRRFIKFLAKQGLVRNLLMEADYQSVTKADAVVTDSQMVARQIKETYGIEAAVNYPGVDINRFRPLRKTSRQYVLKKYGIEHPFMLVTGRYTERKRLDWMIEILAKISAQNKPPMLVLDGQPHQTQMLRLMDLAQKLKVADRIKFIFSEYEDLAAMYGEADLFVFPSPQEFYGLGPVEAMACGTPAVAWDDGSGPSETVLDGVTGYLTLPYDLDDFAGKVYKILSDTNLRENMGREAVAHVRKHLTIDKHIIKLQEVINKVTVGSNNTITDTGVTADECITY
jgi:glycosyltransferase involved in cell wall biosynthesis